MRRKLKNFRNKNGHSTAAPRQLVDETVYRERRNASGRPKWDDSFSGWTHASRNQDVAISLRRVVPPG